MVLLLVQVHEAIQGIAKHRHYFMLHGAVGIGVGGSENRVMLLADCDEQLGALTKSTTFVTYL